MVNATPQPLYSRKGDLVSIVQDAGWGLDGRGKFCPYWDSISGPSSAKRVAVPTEIFLSTSHNKGDLFLGTVEEFRDNLFVTGTSIWKCLVWSLNVTNTGHVWGSALVNNLLSCNS